MAKDDWYFAISTLIAILALLGMDWKMVIGRIHMLESPHTRLRLTLLVVLLSLGLSSYGWYDARYTWKFPIADTPGGQRWAYSPLHQVYRKSFHDEKVILDGNEFIDCTFGNNVTLKYTGIAPFRMTQSHSTAPSTAKFQTDNLVLSNTLNTMSEMGFIKLGSMEIVIENP
jgi:hypothetical protein